MSMDIYSACVEMFQRHRAEAFGGVFHLPAADEYNCLFAWDSAYHALALQHIDVNVAEAELKILYDANTASDGLLSHERPAPGSEERTRIVLQTLGPIYRDDGRSWIIDPPTAAYAAARLYDPKRPSSAALLDSAVAHLDAIDKHRVVDASPPLILHPLESGTDASPQFDALINTASRLDYLLNCVALSQNLQHLVYVAERALAEKHPFVVSDPTFCGWHLLSLEELASAFRRAGDAKRAPAMNARAETLAAAMMRLMWNEEHEIFVSYDHVNKRQLATPTFSGVIAAASATLGNDEIAARIVARHIRSPQAVFQAPSGVSYNPLTNTPVDPWGLLWRGDVASGATSYWAYLALMRNNLPDLAQRIRQQLAALIEKSGFREFYGAVAGEGIGAGANAGFTWPALVLDMTTP
jgi:hypothetical protein